MSPIKYITIKEASDLSGKSIQTVRRMIKSKKIRYRKDKTPQGFNYLIELESAIEVFRLTQNDLSMLSQTQDGEAFAPQATQETVTKTVMAEDQDYAETSTLDDAAETATTLTTLDRSHQKIVSYEPIKEFTDTMQKLIDQHGKEKENLFKLIENFQNKVISLESKLKVETASKKTWFKIW
jgi:hypothetical protein